MLNYVLTGGFHYVKGKVSGRDYFDHEVTHAS